MNDSFQFSQNDIRDILSILRAEALPGSAIAKELIALGNAVFQHREAALYILLHQMERDKLIRGRIRDTAPDQERRFYSLTPLGKARCGGIPAAVSSYKPLTIPENANSSIRTIRLRRWCSDATLGIRVSPDKELVAQELYEHIYDRMAELLARGMDGDSAEQAVIEIMGNPLAINAPLGQLHRPFWTLALRYAHRTMVVLLLLTTFCYGFHYLDTAFFRNTIVEFDKNATPPLSGTHRLLWRDSPNVTEAAEGYRIRAYQTSLWHNTSLDGEERLMLNIQIKISNPIPWAEAPDFGAWIWAQDDLGNHYVCSGLDTLAMEPAIQAIQYHTGPTSYTLDLWILQYVSEDAQWLDLHYDRDGRDIIFRIPLSGGDLQ